MLAVAWPRVACSGRCSGAIRRITGSSVVASLAAASLNFCLRASVSILLNVLIAKVRLSLSRRAAWSKSMASRRVASPQRWSLPVRICAVDRTTAGEPSTRASPCPSRGVAPTEAMSRPKRILLSSSGSWKLTWNCASVRISHLTVPIFSPSRRDSSCDPGVMIAAETGTALLPGSGSIVRSISELSRCPHRAPSVVPPPRRGVPNCCSSSCTTCCARRHSV